MMRLVASLVPYASNSRTHTPAQLDKLARSLKEFGFTNPIPLDGENGRASVPALAGIAARSRARRFRPEGT
jgi:hypothetical protein